MFLAKYFMISAGFNSCIIKAQHRWEDVNFTAQMQDPTSSRTLASPADKTTLVRVSSPYIVTVDAMFS